MAIFAPAESLPSPATLGVSAGIWVIQTGPKSLGTFLGFKGLETPFEKWGWHAGVQEYFQI